jgi:hypothetical protein
MKPLDQEGNELTPSRLPWRRAARPVAGAGRRRRLMAADAAMVARCPGSRIFRPDEQQIGLIFVSVSWN